MDLIPDNRSEAEKRRDASLIEIEFSVLTLAVAFVLIHTLLSAIGLV